MVRFAWVICLVTACKFTPPASSDGDGGTIDTPDGEPPPAREIVPSNHEDTAPLDAADLPDLIMDRVDPDGDTTVWRIYTDTGLIQHEIAGADQFGTYRDPIIGPDPATRLRLDHVDTADASYAVLYVRRLEVHADVSFEGYGDRALIIIARDQIHIVGEIDVSGGLAMPGVTNADTTKGGPGGGDGGLNDVQGDPVAQGCGGRAGTGAGGSAGVVANGDGSGGGGGGGGTAGAKGGDKSRSDVGGGAGAVCLTAALVPLHGGGGGGAGDTDGGGGDGGGGGGALQLSSFVSITIDGVIDAGGKGGFAQQQNDEGGGGGGAGGGILLEAPIVVIGATGILAANGGGGGSGRTAEEHGDQGTLTTQGALGGSGSGGGMNDGRGGNGAALDDATPGDDHDPGGGGGGGGVGAIRLNADGAKLMLSPNAVISPIHTEGQVVLAR